MGSLGKAGKSDSVAVPTGIQFPLNQRVLRQVALYLPLVNLSHRLNLCSEEEISCGRVFDEYFGALPNRGKPSEDQLCKRKD